MPDHKDREIERRAFWSGTLTFGLVSIPVALFPGNRAGQASLRMLAPDGTPLKRRYFCPKENRPLTNDEIVRGFEIEKDRFVVLSDEELESVEPKKSKEIDLHLFVPREQIDPIYFDRAYFLVPTGDSSKAYRLLAETLEKTGRAGVATFIMRSKEYLVAILSEQGILRAETLRFAQEVRTPQEMGLAEPGLETEAELKTFTGAIRAALINHFDPNQFKDEGEEKKSALIREKKATGRGILHPPQEVEEEAEEGGAEVIDLMAVLKRKLAEKEAAPGKKKPHNRETPEKTTRNQTKNPPAKKRTLGK